MTELLKNTIQNINADVKTYETPNKYFNTLIGGGYDSNRVYLFLIPSRYKGILDTLNISAMKEIIDGDINYHEDVYDVEEIISIRNETLQSGKGSIVVNYVPSMREGQMKYLACYEVMKHSDTNIALFIDSESLIVKYEVLKQKKYVTHGLMYPYEQKI